MRRTFDGLPRTATYMDDVGQEVTTVTEALDFLNEALRRVVINGLKMDLRKCQLIQDKVSFLGYVISAEGRTLDESRVAAVEKFEPHRNAKKLYSFLQFANHYRKFIPEFAKVMHKLRRLLAKDVPFVWTDAHEATVNAIKHALKNPPILVSFRPDCPTNAQVDASQTGLGAVLSQTQDGKERIIEYASRSLNEPDRGLHSNMVECVALHSAITEKFSVYLRGGPRFTVFTDNFSLSYLVQKGASNRRFARWTLDLAEYTFDHKSSDYEIENDILVKKSLEGGRVRRRVIIPAALRSSVMIIFHDNNGHLGVEKTRDLIQRKYWWPSMRKDIREYVDSCHTCQTINARTTGNEGCLIPRDIPTEPNTVISLDHMGPLNEKGDHILVCIDHATRYMDAVTVPSTSLTHYLDFMTNRWIPQFGVPNVIITDQAKGFVNKKTNQFHRRLGIAHQNSPPYWPQSNGLIERMVGTLKQVLRKMLNNKDKWQKELPRETLAINATKHRHSGHSPFRLMHGYDPKLPGELNLASVEGDIDESHRLHDLARGRAETRERLLQSQRETTVRYDKKR
ncbi:hypothetical protein MRX96_041367 [Rhipicephalus microplus]